MRFSIRTKLLLGFALLGLLSSLVQVFGVVIIEDYFHAQVEQSLKDKADLAATQILNLRSRIELDHLGIAREYGLLESGDVRQLAGIIDFVLSQNPFYQKITILSPTGKEILKIDQFSQIPDESLDFEIPTQSFTQALDGNTGVSKVYFLEPSSSPQVDIFTPILSFDKQVIGVIKSQIRLDSLWDVLAQIQIGKQGLVYVVDDEGRLIAHPDRALVLQAPNYAERPLIKAMINHQTNQLTDEDFNYLNDKQEPVIAMAKLIPDLNWVVIVEEPQSEAFSQINILRSVFRGATVASIGLLILISFFLSHRLSQPIKKLQSFSESLSKGNLRIRSDISTGDEIEDLSTSFNSMASQLNSLVDQLAENNQNLEQEKTHVEAERNKLSIIMHEITDSVIAVDKQRKIVIFNKAAEKITGYQISEAKDKPISDLLRLYGQNGEISVDIYCPIKPGDYEGLVYHQDKVKLVGKEDKTTYVNIVSGKIKEGESVNLGTILTIHNVTPERELEKMKLDFVAMAAHELRTPLTTVLGYLSFIQKPKTADKLAENEREYLSKAMVSATRLNRLIDNLLVVSKIDQGRMVVNVKPTNLGKLIEKMAKEFTNLAQVKGLQMNIETEDNLPEVMADPVALEEVIINLVGNAINYTLSGSITVKVRRNEDQVMVSIADTGKGIPKEAIPHLFTKFFRVIGELQSGAKGTGLGLYISKKIVDSLGGKIWVESNLNQGSTFYFSLPIAKMD